MSNEASVLSTSLAQIERGLPGAQPPRSAKVPTTANGRPSRVLKNSALLFIKPHCNSPRIVDFVKNELHAHGIDIIRQGTLKGSDMARDSTIDKHYAAIGRYAVSLPAKQLLPLFSTEARATFQKVYGLSPEAAAGHGMLMNAREAMERYKLAPLAVADAFEKGKQNGLMIKIAPGCYASRIQVNLTDEGGQDLSPISLPIVINGFYLKMRDEYVADTAEVTWFVLEWPEDSLSWTDFRGKVLGATDPTKAYATSMRRKLMEMGPMSLGLAFTPSMGANCLHGSASPLEALQERLVWCSGGARETQRTQHNSQQKSSNNTTPKTIVPSKDLDVLDYLRKDSFGRLLLEEKGLRYEAVLTMLTNPTLCCGRTLFDVVEGTNTSQCANMLVGISLSPSKL